MRSARILAAAVLAAGCQSGRTATNLGSNAGSGSIAVWLTSGDQRHLLERQPDIHWAAMNGAAAAAASITVEASRSFQEMIGFGAAMTDASAFLLQKLPATVRDSVMEDLFGRGQTGSNGARELGIGMSFLRVPMGASDFSMTHYSYDDMPAGESDSTLSHFSIEPDRRGKLPLLRRALAINPQLKVVASPWSPPGWMKTTDNLVKGTLQPVYYDSFAEYFVKFIRAYEREGVPVFAVTLQNEPSFEPDNYPGMKLDAAARARVIGQHVGPRFASAGIRALIWDWDHNWDLPQQPLDVLADSSARKYIQGVAWHCYGGEVGAQSIVHDRYPGKDAYFTECSGGEWSPRFDENLQWTINTLVIGATRNWARGVLLWNLALDPAYGPHLGGCGNCRGVLTIDTTRRSYTRNVEYYALAHASKFVRSGARRIESTGGDSTLTHVAFRNPDDGSIALVVLNSEKSARAFVVRVNGQVFGYALPAVSAATFVIPQRKHTINPNQASS